MNSDRTMKLYGKLESLYADKEQWEERIAFLNRLDSFVETMCGDMDEQNMLKKIISDEVFTVEKRSFRVDLYINHTKKEYEHERTADGSNEKTEELK